ncbi:MAG TPA: TIGR02300 family protein [Hyphomicrobiaceae bacterium]|nr:TIGR02300 family protein [Hyphomicrobiaceae bacterium]
MATKQARGTKRTCQNPDCGSRFYDLDRDPIVCPICGSEYVIATAPLVAAAPEEKDLKAKKPEFADEVAAVPEAEVEGAEVLAEIDTAEDAVAEEGDETFLEEEEEDGGDVSGIIGGTVAGDEEET